MIVYAMSMKGPHKEMCEDCMLVGNNIISEGYVEWQAEERFTIAVADGVGGNNAGEEASFLALKGIRDSKLFQGAKLQFIESVIKNTNQTIVKESEANSEWKNMATTMSGIYMDPNKTILYHVGNTRVYSLNGQYLRQITVDHTNVNYWVQMGILTRKEAENHPQRNEINACLGGGNAELASKCIVKDISEEITIGQDLFLTTDGVHDYLSIDEMENIIGGDGTIKEKLALLYQKARENGSDDDVSIIWLHYES